MRRNYSLFVLVVFIFSFLVYPGFQNILADQTVVLRPTVDGSEDSANWKNTGGTACNSTSCSIEVDESSGSSCTNSDGDTSYADSDNNGAKQTFDIDESIIPDNSTITQISITVCHKDISALLTSTFKTRRCIDGTCTSFGTNITTGSSYAEATQDHSGLNITKTSTTDLEIGVHVVNAAKAGGPRISQISTVITYTPPPSSGGGSGGPNYAKIIFSGEAFPGAILGTYLVIEIEGVNPIPYTTEFASERDGSFRQEILVPDAGKKTFFIVAKDNKGNTMRSKDFILDLKNGVTTRRDNIILAPSVSVGTTSLLRGKLLVVSGLAAPGNEVELFIDDVKIDSLELKSLDDFGTGMYEFSVDTGKLGLGSHKIQVRQVDPVKNITSDFSEIQNVKLNALVPIDFNDDQQLNTKDWSIFLYNWSSKDPEITKKDDLNKDGRVSLADFSLFLKYFQLSGS